MMTLKIGSLSIPLRASLDIDQSYEPIGGESVFRTINGTGIKQATWAKTRIVTSGSGWMPAGLESLNVNQQLVLACVVPRRVPANFATRQATLPAARRSDAGCVPWALAILADDSVVQTSVTMAGNVATAAAVSGAVSYEILYLPQFTVWASRPTDSGNRGEASYTWQLVCEEV